MTTSSSRTSWTEPLKISDFTIDLQSTESLRFYIKIADRDKLLSAILVGKISECIYVKGPAWGDEVVPCDQVLGEIVEPLHTISVRVLFNSYKMAVALSQPLFIAIIVIRVLFQIAFQGGNTHSDAMNALDNIRELDEDSDRRVMYLSPPLYYPNSYEYLYDASLFMKTALKDLQSFNVNKYDTSYQGLILNAILANAEATDFANCSQIDMEELIDLAAHYWFAENKYEIVVTELPKKFPQVFGALVVGEGRSSGISLCMGQAAEALGRFELAAQIYHQFQHEEYAEKVEQLVFDKKQFLQNSCYSSLPKFDPLSSKYGSDEL